MLLVEMQERFLNCQMVSSPTTANRQVVTIIECAWTTSYKELQNPSNPVYLRGTLFVSTATQVRRKDDSQSRVLHVGTSSVTDRLVGDGEFTEVVTGHLWLDLDGGEGLSVLFISFLTQG